MNLENLVEPLLAICEDAMQGIMNIYEETKDVVYEKKDDNSPLTEADKASHAIIVAGLSILTPEIQIISEEHKNLDYEDRKDLDYVWCVDPLDGTKEFIKRNGEFTVNIALIQDGKPVVGIVGLPAHNVIYYATEGHGAFKYENGQSQKIEAANFTKNDKGLKIVASRSHMNDETKAFADQYDEATFVSRGSALKFTIIAEGNAHIYPRIAPTMEWDTAAAQAVLVEAGGSVVRYDNHEPLTYNKENLLNPFFVAYGHMV